MSITTRRGDEGETDLLFGKRVRKDDPRVHATGAIDELNAALGIARATRGAEASSDPVPIARLQEDLVALMGELNTLPEDAERYRSAGYSLLGRAAIERLDQAIAGLESELPPPTGWVMPGAAGHLGAAHLELARTVCRRAEREVLGLGEEAIAGGAEDFEGLVYLNRLSDYLWLLARAWEVGAP